MPSGLVQSMTILPERLPRLFTAVSVACHGVARTIVSVFRAASRGVWSLSRGNELYLGSVGLGTPKTTSSPARSQPRPSAEPTLPAPMIAIHIIHSVEIGFHHPR